MKTYFILAFYFFKTAALFSQSRDTIYFNSRWEICDKPLAQYFRIGEVKTDGTKRYSGTVADFYINGTPEMEGSYTEQGVKSGPFTFYYLNGKIKSHGNYSENKISGFWDFYHEDGTKYAVLYFPGDGFNFSVLDFTDSTGKMTCKDGTGTFVWKIYQSPIIYYRIEGQFDTELRQGTWLFYYVLEGKERLTAKEIYEKGKLIKGVNYGFNGQTPYDNVGITINFDENKLLITESFALDEMKRAERAINNPNNQRGLFTYLFNMVVDAYVDTTGTSMQGPRHYLLKMLNTNSNYFLPNKQDYSGKIHFFLPNEGYLKNISMEGNLSEMEKARTMLILQKFNVVDSMKNHDIMEVYHDIYFFSIELNLTSYSGSRSATARANFVIFSSMPKEMFLQAFKKLSKGRRDEFYIR